MAGQPSEASAVPRQLWRLWAIAVIDEAHVTEHEARAPIGTECQILNTAQITGLFGKARVLECGAAQPRSCVHFSTPCTWLAVQITFEALPIAPVSGLFLFSHTLFCLRVTCRGIPQVRKQLACRHSVYAQNDDSTISASVMF